MRMDGEPVLETLLAWYLAAGADEAVADAPNDRFAEEVRRRRPPVPTVAPAAATTAPAVAAARPIAIHGSASGGLGPDSPAAAIAAAREAASAASTIEELRAAVANFDGCTLRATATNTVFA